MTRHVDFDHDPGRVAANRELGRAWRAVKAARTFFITFAVVSGLVLLGTMLLAGETGVGRTIVGLQSLLFGTYLIGSFRIHREPLVWALVGALLESAIAALTLSIFHFVLAAGCWAAFVVVLPVPRLLRQYPDLRISSKFGPRWPKDGSRGSARRRRR